MCDFNAPLLSQWLTEEQLSFRGAAEPEPSPAHPPALALISSHLEEGESLKTKGRFRPRALGGGKERVAEQGCSALGFVFSQCQGPSKCRDGMQPLGLAGDAGGKFLDQSSVLGAVQSVKSQHELQQPLLKGLKGVKWPKPSLTSGTSLFPELFQLCLATERFVKRENP